MSKWQEFLKKKLNEEQSDSQAADIITKNAGTVADIIASDPASKIKDKNKLVNKIKKTAQVVKRTGMNLSSASKAVDAAEKLSDKNF